LRVPISVAWLLIVLAFFTAGLLRQFHDGTPHSPYVPPVVGSLLFAAIFFLLLVAAREWRRGAVPGPGIRLGSLTPILLMLLIEKWISLALYNPIFYFIAPFDAPPAYLDAWYVLFAGVGLILVCLLAGRLSLPTLRKTWRRARPGRWPASALACGIVIVGSYGLLGALAWALGGTLRFAWPEPSPLLIWILIGQGTLAFSEEVYYRGLLMSEVERLAPRLGVRSAATRRWVALFFTATLFGMEHLALTAAWEEVGRQLIFTVALGLLLGLLVMISASLHFSAGIHAWINWLLLGAAPYFVDPAGQPALPAGTYIGVALILAFVLSFGIQRWQLRHPVRSRASRSQRAGR